MADLTSGDRVVHTKIDAWGPGQVIAAMNDELVKVVFVNAGLKTLHLGYATLTKLSGSAAKNDDLDRLVSALEEAKAEEVAAKNQEARAAPAVAKIGELDAMADASDDWVDDFDYDE